MVKKQHPLLHTEPPLGIANLHSKSVSPSHTSSYSPRDQSSGMKAYLTRAHLERRNKQTRPAFSDGIYHTVVIPSLKLPWPISSLDKKILTLPEFQSPYGYSQPYACQKVKSVRLVWGLPSSPTHFLLSFPDSFCPQTMWFSIRPKSIKGRLTFTQVLHTHYFI